MSTKRACLPIMVASGAAFFLAACMGGPVDPLVSKLRTCQAVERAVIALAGYRAAGSLSDVQVAQVESVRPLTIAVCADGGETVPESTLETVERRLQEMLLVEAQVEGEDA